MKQDKDINRGLAFIIYILAAGFLLGTLLFSTQEKDAPEFKDDERIAIRLKQEKVKECLESNLSEENWGKVSFGFRWCTITTRKGQRFYDILRQDDAAKDISEAYGNLFQYEEDDDECTFRMKASWHINGAKKKITMPAWLVAKLIDAGALNPKTDKK